MKKTITILITLLACQYSFGHSFSEGFYKGHALWNSIAAKGVYQTTMTIDKNTIKTHYSLPDGSSHDWNFTMQDKSSIFFDVISQGAKLGTGYCLEKVSVCHYEITIGQLKLEETLVQEGNKIYRYGSKDNSNSPVTWQESLDKK